MSPASEEYPADLKYHPEHDWARIEGEEATLGITWHAQDALGELVHYEPPGVGASVVKDATYGEIESVKAVSDVISPLSGEVLEVNQKVVDAPETVNDDPYGEGWLVRIRLADPGRGGIAARRRRVPGRPRRVLAMAHPFLFLTESDREEMLSTIGVSDVDELFRDIPAGVRLDRDSISSRRSPSRSSWRTWASSPAATLTPVSSSRSWAPASTTTTFQPSSMRSSRAASS